MGIDSTPRASISAYAARPVTKAPDWHGLVRLDLLFNNLSTGLFLVAALGELVAPASLRPIAVVAYPIALLFLVADLVCLVLDLGDPSRFHHMLRVWKPSSPMSLGTWCLTAYAVPLTALAVISLLPGGGVSDAARRAILVAGLVPAVAAGVYKGVLFSTTAQRGWGDARWLGGYLINAALVLGAAEALLLAIVMGQPRAVIALRLALRLLLLLNLLGLALLLVDLRDALSAARRRRDLLVLGVLAVVGGKLLPLLLLALEAPIPLVVAVLLILLGAVVVRNELVGLPHRLGQPSHGG
jgi:hypothetical protein